MTGARPFMRARLSVSPVAEAELRAGNWIGLINIYFVAKYALGGGLFPPGHETYHRCTRLMAVRSGVPVPLSASV